MPPEIAKDNKAFPFIPGPNPRAFATLNASAAEVPEKIALLAIFNADIPKNAELPANITLSIILD